MVTLSVVRAMLVNMFADEQFESFVEYWCETVPSMSAQDQASLHRLLLSDWKHDKLLRALT